jgi:hypothetical protein
MNRLLILGGAILVLAACDNATAPTISHHDGPAAAAVKRAPVSAPVSSPTSGGGTMNSMSGGCTWLRLGGSDSVLVCDEAIY